MKNTTEIPNEMLGPSKFTLSARYLYCVLLKYIKEEGDNDWVRVSQKRLAKDLGYTVRHVRNLLKELQDNYFLTVSRGTCISSNGYTLTISSTLLKLCISARNSGNEFFLIGNTAPSTYCGNSISSVKEPDSSNSLEEKGIIRRTEKRVREIRH